jgi:AraC-like DNA-binding protein
MSLQRLDIAVIPALTNYVERIFVFYSDGQMPAKDLKLIIPNGLVKLIVPVQNSFSGKIDGQQHLLRENRMMLIGADDLPTLVDIQKNEAAVNITIEFKPAGAYRFFDLNYRNIRNKAYAFADIFGVSTQSLEEQLANTQIITKKIKLLQTFLSNQLKKQEADSVFDYSIQRIKDTHGSISLKELERKTGYTSRWLNTKFSEKIGISPKNFASICRFQSCYALFTQNPQAFLKEKEFYNYFYDQTHFIKDFRRFTGLPPLQFTKTSNCFKEIIHPHPL